MQFWTSGNISQNSNQRLPQLRIFLFVSSKKYALFLRNDEFASPCTKDVRLGNSYRKNVNKHTQKNTKKPAVRVVDEAARICFHNIIFYELRQRTRWIYSPPPGVTRQNIHIFKTFRISKLLLIIPLISIRHTFRKQRADIDGELP